MHHAGSEESEAAGELKLHCVCLQGSSSVSSATPTPTEAPKEPLKATMADKKALHRQRNRQVPGRAWLAADDMLQACVPCHVRLCTVRQPCRVYLHPCSRRTCSSGAGKHISWAREWPRVAALLGSPTEARVFAAKQCGASARVRSSRTRRLPCSRRRRSGSFSG